MDHEFKIMDELVRRTVGRLVWDFTSISREDLYQSLWEVVLEGELTSGQPGLRAFLYRKGRELAWAERREQLRSSVQYEYRTEDLKIILETCFESKDGWPGFFVPSDANEGEKDNMAGVEIRTDAMLAFQRLSWDYQDSILARYRENEMPESGSPEQKKLSRALKAMATIMNSY